jgi:hypothetical protein
MYWKPPVAGVVFKRILIHRMIKDISNVVVNKKQRSNNQIKIMKGNLSNTLVALQRTDE